ncbi:Asp-tRNA(Asn)/Glu-tRNA(Gln) amidotransferase GatCAB subunit C [Cereibacter sphaeroides]|uniref:Asp-tRNA(Asn)/Glu-tRNA(Gln) amidotransferase GatCAB subunit C n=1 Tax=Cereibacter sphaeroides TaxID=1063 RepID=A0AAX1UF88_CERSP|nr:molybdopterin guanine dinucleotide-containing S/N-oxide reductase [Cereibacter sphaeroides]RHZ90811.1 Asp-tRNA(Asn)/Glu-tRNA(Gln) amidotransferase GatCAB subunit C [Cereibacter sphaeroides]
MTRYTASHWGIYEVHADEAGEPRLAALTGDPDPSEIGLHQLDPAILDTRVARPSVRKSWLEKGPGADPHLRGKEPFVEVSWETALDLVAGEVERVRRTHGNEAIFGGSYGWASAGRFHHAQSQVHRFLNTAGGYVWHTASYSLGAAHVIMPRIVARMDELMSQHTSWDVMAEHTELFVTFGGVPRKNAQSSPGGAGFHRVTPGLHAMAEAGVRFINVGPFEDNLDPVCRAEWIRCRPNSDTALMLALAWQLVADGRHDAGFLATHCTGFDRFLPYLTGEADGVAKTPDWAAPLTGVPAERIVRLAREMADHRTMLNIAWSLQRAEFGEQPFWMFVTLAAMLGQIGLPGGGFGAGYGPANTMGTPHRKLPGPTLSQGMNPVARYIPVARIADMLLNPGAEFLHDGARRTYADIRMIYWAGGNPYHHHQDLNRLETAWQKPETIVIHEPFWTASAKRADIVLPVTTAMERNDLGYSSQEGFLVAMRQIRPPFAEARNDYDIFLGLAERLGLAEAFGEGRDEMGWLRHLYGQMRGRWAEKGVAIPEFDTFWEQGLVDLSSEAAPVVMFEAFRADPEAHPLSTPSGKIEIFSEAIASFDLPDCSGHPEWRAPREWLGAPGRAEGMLHLISDQPSQKLHSQLDMSPHSRGAKQDDRELVHVNPADAARRGLSDGDVVELFNSRGRCLGAVRVNPAVMEGVVRMATGSWYDPQPDGLEKHGNPNVLTQDVGTSSLAQGCAAQSCLVELRGPINAEARVTAFDRPELLTA